MTGIFILLPIKRFLHQLINRIGSKIKPSATISSEFLAWRQQFLSSRIRLLAWVILIILVMVTIFHLTITIPSLNASGDPKLAFDANRIREYLENAITQIFSVSIGLLLSKSRIFQKSPERMFLLLSGLVLMPSQIIATLRGKASFDEDMWILFYAIQAILIPVHWRSHLISQVTVIGYFAIAMLLGWRDPHMIVPAAYALGIFYTILICVVADVGIFLYERSLQREFELRQQLQIFLHAVSHDLRNPVIGLVMTLKTFWNPKQQATQIPQELLKQMIESGERQVALINLLLEAHKTEIHGIVLHHQPVKLHELVQSVISDLQPFIQQANATVTHTIPTDLP